MDELPYFVVSPSMKTIGVLSCVRFSIVFLSFQCCFRVRPIHVCTPNDLTERKAAHLYVRRKFRTINTDCSLLLISFSTLK